MIISNDKNSEEIDNQENDHKITTKTTTTRKMTTKTTTMKTTAMNTDNEDNDNWSMSGSDMPSALGLITFQQGISSNIQDFLFSHPLMCTI